MTTESTDLFHDIGSLAGPGVASEATDINDRGDVVGMMLVPGATVCHAFISSEHVDGGRLVDVTPGETRSSMADAVNGSGVVAGTLGVSMVAGALGPPQIVGYPVEPFLWSPDAGLEILPLPPGCSGGQAVDIDDSRRVLVTGTNDAPDLPRGLPVGCFLWDPERRAYTKVLSPDPSDTSVIALGHTLDGADGLSGGLVTLVGEHWKHTAAVWDAGTLAPRQLAGTDCFANHTNGKGMAVGWRMSTPGAPTAAYWPSLDAEPVELPGRSASKVDDDGRIVGVRDFAGSAAFPFAAVLWEPARDRTTVLGDRGLGSYVLAVNASGRSAGYVVAPGDGSPTQTAGWWDPPLA
jgi:hypothetical protein